MDSNFDTLELVATTYVHAFRQVHDMLLTSLTHQIKAGERSWIASNSDTMKLVATDSHFTMFYCAVLQ